MGLRMRKGEAVVRRVERHMQEAYARGQDPISGCCAIQEEKEDKKEGRGGGQGDIGQEEEGKE